MILQDLKTVCRISGLRVVLILLSVTSLFRSLVKCSAEVHEVRLEGKVSRLYDGLLGTTLL